jgi:hypothetical protein
MPDILIYDFQIPHLEKNELDLLMIIIKRFDLTPMITKYLYMSDE